MYFHSWAGNGPVRWIQVKVTNLYSFRLLDPNESDGRYLNNREGHVLHIRAWKASSKWSWWRFKNIACILCAYIMHIVHWELRVREVFSKCCTSCVSNHMLLMLWSNSLSNTDFWLWHNCLALPFCLISSGFTCFTVLTCMQPPHCSTWGQWSISYRNYRSLVHHPISLSFYTEYKDSRSCIKPLSLLRE